MVHSVVDDYAHHPTELKATLSAAKRVQRNQLYGVYSNHILILEQNLYLNEFAEAFYSADKVIITDIYAARER